MIWIILITVALLIWVCSPYLDIFKDNDGKTHIILWYNTNYGRKYISLKGGY